MFLLMCGLIAILLMSADCLVMLCHPGSVVVFAKGENLHSPAMCLPLVVLIMLVLMLTSSQTSALTSVLGD